VSARHGLQPKGMTRNITFERKVLRRIYGPYYNTSTQQYEIRHNEDFYSNTLTLLPLLKVSGYNGLDMSGEQKEVN